MAERKEEDGKEGRGMEEPGGDSFLSL